MYENGFIKKLKLISKFMTLQTGQQIFTIHVLPNVSRSKGNQVLKFGKLMKHDVRIVFVQTLCRK